MNSIYDTNTIFKRMYTRGEIHVKCMQEVKYANMSEFDPCSRLLFLVTDIILALATFPSLPMC